MIVQNKEVHELKRAFKIVAIGACLGIALVFLQKFFQIDEDVFMHWYWIAAPAVVIGAVLVNLSYNIFYQSKVRKAAKLLGEGKPQEYINRMEGLLKTAKGQNLRNVLTLNLTAGYVELKQFDTAIRILEELSSKRLIGSTVKVVHRLNLFMSYFGTEQYEKAKELYDKNRKLFEQCRNSKIYGANVAILDILVTIMNKQYEQAKEMLDMACKQYDDSRFQRTFYEISDILESKCQEP